MGADNLTLPKLNRWKPFIYYLYEKMKRNYEHLKCERQAKLFEFYIKQGPDLAVYEVMRDMQHILWEIQDYYESKEYKYTTEQKNVFDTMNGMLYMSEKEFT